MCDYDKSIRPVVNHSSNITVTIRMILKFFEYQPILNTISVHSWLVVFWKDEHLKWTPADYESIKQFYISSDEIWTPDLSIYNKNDLSGDLSAFSAIKCLLSYNGLVVCVSPSRHDGMCIADLKKYPYDQQNCTLRYGSWVHTGEEIDFKTASPPISVTDYLPNSNWKLLKVTIQKNHGHYNCCPDNTFPSISYKFYIERHSATQAASIIIPSLVLIIVTLTTLWMNPEEFDRLCLACCNLVAHILHLQMVSIELPSSGDVPPLLIVYSRDSLLLCTFTIVLSVILKTMLRSSKSSPAWISTIVSGILSNRPGQLFLLYEGNVKSLASARNEEDTVNIIENGAPEPNRDWKMFAILIDRLSFIAFLVTYAFMFITFIV
ncbi:hypothetical protein FQA39_LY03508 [Lamprigera yunnana]|nr:hypothetical protein FQA39_LY03508 [Lamprigera yunnana]